MTRRDTLLDAMLRNLGAAYYHTTQGTARAADVTRALESVAEEDRRINGGEPAPVWPAVITTAGGGCATS
jgi:hypothetical protein